MKFVVNLQTALDNYDMINELDEIKAEISDIEIKNNSKTKSPKFVLQSYAYVYFEVMDFSPNLKSGNYVLTTKSFFENVQSHQRKNTSSSFSCKM